MGRRPKGRPGRGVLIRDVAIFQLKLVIDELTDLFVMQLALAAALLDLVFPGRDGPRFFYRVLRAAERFDLWLNLYRPTGGVRDDADGLFGTSPAGGDSLLGKLEEMVRGPERPREAGFAPSP